MSAQENIVCRMLGHNWWQPEGIFTRRICKRCEVRETKGCDRCAKCDPDYRFMRLCPTCGNKRCPHATDHRLPCSGSNEPGQAGSLY